MGTPTEHWKESLDKALYDKKQPWTDALEWAEIKSGIKRKYLLVGESSDNTIISLSDTRQQVVSEVKTEQHTVFGKNGLTSQWAYRRYYIFRKMLLHTESLHISPERR